MDFLIEHHSSYKYSSPVFLEPHYLYFHPAARPHIHLAEFSLEVSPTPQGCSARLDTENNVYYQCWFIEKLDRLQVTAKAKIKTTPINPFYYLVDESREAIDQAPLKLYSSFRHELSSNLNPWLDRLKPLMENDTTDFLRQLCYEISAGWKHTIRYEEHLIDPSDCFKSRVGSCRDLSWMMIHILRNLGFPSRFVSGYCFNPELRGHELHAWVETWVTGAGWIGLDPSAGIFVTGEYIPVSSSHHPANTLPVQGTYRGEAKSELETKVDIKVLN